MKFCKDCSYMVGDGVTALCNAPQNFIPNTDEATYLVTGDEQPVQTIRLGSNCRVCRTYDQHPGLKIVMCGPEGIWFKAKDA